ncbi:MAG: flavodoxin family protein [Acidiferrobacterales bacterium]|nr:flavodoxin family protein [Acidiferrobacterales bacterium]
MAIRVGFAYFTSTDITGKLVTSAATAVERAGAEALLLRIDDTEIVKGRYTNKRIFDDLDKCHAIIFASPTYMGAPAAQFKAFADATSAIYSQQSWKDKYAAGITSGSGLNGDQSSTLQYFATLASQHGMSWLGLSETSNSSKRINRLGCQLGVVAQSTTSSVHQIDLSTAASLGNRIAKRVLRDYG